MWIKLDLEGLKLELKIENYIPKQTIDGTWANVSFNFEFQDIINIPKMVVNVYYALKLMI